MYVYFIRSANKKSLVQVKIGLSKDPNERLRNLQFTSPTKLSLIGVIKCKSKLHSFHVERTLHDRFKKQRRHGEWFHLSNEHLNQILELIASEKQPEQLLQRILMNTIMRSLIQGFVKLYNLA